MQHVLALAGGVGAARLLRGLVQLLRKEELVIIGNVGDDLDVYGLHVSPDLDIVMYTLAGIVDEEKGWGVSGDTFKCLAMLGKYGIENWFKTGDLDLATHIARTQMLKNGLTLSEVTATLCDKLGMKAKLVPVTNDHLRSKVVSGRAVLDFQDYFVRRGTRDEVTSVLFEGADKARPAPGVIEAIREADRIIICPSNPILSILPILSLPEVKEEVINSNAYVVAVSPIIGGKTLKGPADRIMVSMGHECSAYGVAKFYQDLIDHIIIDEADREHKQRIENLGIKATVTDTIMKTQEHSRRLAKTAVEAR